MILVLEHIILNLWFMRALSLLQDVVYLITFVNLDRTHSDAGNTKIDFLIPMLCPQPIHGIPKVLFAQIIYLASVVGQRVAWLNPLFSCHAQTICLTPHLSRLWAGLFLFRRRIGF